MKNNGEDNIHNNIIIKNPCSIVPVMDPHDAHSTSEYFIHLFYTIILKL